MEAKKTKKRRKINTGKLMIVLSLILMLVIGSYAFLNSSIFDMKNIQIKGNDQIEDKAIVNSLGINNDKNIFMYSTKQLEEQLKENPYIESATINKKLPNTLKIQVKERKSVAILKCNDKYCYIDKSGKLLGVVEKIKDKNKEIVVDISYNINENKEIKFENEQTKKRLLYLLECIQKNNLSKKIGEIKFEKDEKISILTKQRIKVLLYKDEKISYNVSRMSAILAELQNDNIKGGAIDLTYSNYAVYRP
ncbi:cell division protein FtsQ/DivIB [Romboutsia sp.]|uniref:cell division protein FtsQ/DivIB n=1 Tax=Romboutsia sp. TaxID=1965302 RepID=UPI003F3A7F67